MSEQWRPIPGFARYEVSSEGRVRSTQWTKPRLLAIHPDGSGYSQVVLYGPTRDRRRFTKRVHRLVLLAFVGPCPEGMEVRHLNGNRSDNQLANLAYGTPSENSYDKVRHGTHHCARKTHCKRGHPFDAANTYLSSDNRRICRTCAREANRRNNLRRRKKAA